MAGRWEFIDHTADVGLVARGADLDELFANAGLGLFDLMIDAPSVGESVSRRIEVAGRDRTDLLVAWLNELLYQFEVAGIVFARFEVSVSGDGRRLVATGHGEPFDPRRHAVKIGVKAATYHEAAVEEIPDGPERGWRARVILDV